MDSVFFISLMNGAAWGGSEELWFRTALYAAKKGYKVGCAFYDWPQKKDRIEQLKKAGCQVYLFSNKGREKKTPWQRLRYKITKRRVRQYARSLPLSQYNITVISLGSLEVVSHYWREFDKYVKNYALLFHAHNENDNIKPRKKLLLQKWVLQAKHNLFASARTKVYLEKQLSMAVPNANVLINPLSFDAPREYTAYPPLRNGNYLFVMLAALDTKRKAQDNLVKALSTQKWKERPWQLYLYGNGNSTQQLRKLIDKTNLNGKIFLKGHTANAKLALSEAHLLLQITHIDAMPLAVMEGLAVGRPIVASNVGDMPEWVIVNWNGWISDDASIEAIDAVLENCWQARSNWEEMGRHSFQFFQEKFPAIPEEYFLDQLFVGQHSLF